MKRRILSILTLLCMVTALLPVNVTVSAYTGEDIPFTTDKVYTSAKVMVWDSLSALKSVCDAEIIK